MRYVFEEELNQLNKDMISMSALCEEAIGTAVDYLLAPETNRKKDVLDIVDQVNHKEREIENMCLKLLMQQQPVASDLRVISAVLKMVSDLERVGDNADDIAEIVSMDNINPASVKNIHLDEMATAARKMLSDSINAFVKRDEALARQVIEDDDIVDSFFDRIKIKLSGDFGKENPNLDELLDLFMVTKYFERISDHSVNIAQWVVFVITGKLEGNTN